MLKRFLIIPNQVATAASEAIFGSASRQMGGTAGHYKQKSVKFRKNLHGNSKPQKKP
jgi:hypothetical protein